MEEFMQRALRLCSIPNVPIARAQVVFIPGPLPGMNEALDSKAHQNRADRKGKRFTQWGEDEKDWQRLITIALFGGRVYSTLRRCQSPLLLILLFPSYFRLVD